MSDPARAMVPALSPEDLHRQLEGGLEHIEATSSCYGRLDEALSGKDWRKRLREQPHLASEVLERDAACLEALEDQARHRRDFPPNGTAVHILADWR
ncbi:hypothetical protein HPC49_37930 [Pyxidicoccus fallax]|uniref:Uncharacterized protein n=1 Tax=Pyxidicoccus fallax TaxID=394095 RepID=A0A848LWT2_9BACT|nr:hypothetical protein [Pyxidicoccus fallax]NMO22012.1 hypothetical protein [Pyxidicoccus fallax]NPC83981.1 hypothetical protein [Pyxidicoccus fallax]